MSTENDEEVEFDEFENVPEFTPNKQSELDKSLNSDSSQSQESPSKKKKQEVKGILFTNRRFKLKK